MAWVCAACGNEVNNEFNYCEECEEIIEPVWRFEEDSNDLIMDYTSFAIYQQQGNFYAVADGKVYLLEVIFKMLVDDLPDLTDDELLKFLPDANYTGETDDGEYYYCFKIVEEEFL